MPECVVALESDGGRDVLDRLRTLGQSATPFIEAQIFDKRRRCSSEYTLESPHKMARRQANAFGQRIEGKITPHMGSRSSLSKSSSSGNAN